MMLKKSINVEHDVNIHLENKKISRHFFIFIFIMYAFVYMTKNCFNGALADIVSEGILTKSQTGLIVAMFYLAYTPMQIVGGIVVDKFSPELMIKIGLVGGAVANAVIFFNHNYYVMLVTWTLNAIVQFALWPATFKIVSSQLCRSDRTYMIFLISLASSFGLIVSYLIAAVMPSWEYNFAFSALVLFILAVILHIYDRHLNRFMKRDYAPLIDSNKIVSAAGQSTLSIFWKSGFVLFLVSVLLYSTVGQGVKTLFPVMLVETAGSAASLGNLVNTLIIVSGIFGTLLVRLVIYPRVIKNELVGLMLSMLIATAFSLILMFVSGVPIMVTTLCVMSVTTTAPAIFSSYFNTRFSRYGKNGTAAGICNAASAFGFVLSSYGVVRISEAYDWQTVKLVWFISLLVSFAVFLVIIPMNAHFRRKEDSK